jgi:hypothetical protein
MKLTAGSHLLAERQSKTHCDSDKDTGSLALLWIHMTKNQNCLQIALDIQLQISRKPVVHITDDERQDLHTFTL